MLYQRLLHVTFFDERRSDKVLAQHGDGCRRIRLNSTTTDIIDQTESCNGYELPRAFTLSSMLLFIDYSTSSSSFIVSRAIFF